MLLFFKRKRNTPFASLSQINDKLDRLVSMGVLSKVEYCEWASLVIYVKKKTKQKKKKKFVSAWI